MSKSSPSLRAIRAGSRHWLLLVLLLLVAGQTLAAEHRHGDQLNLHSDCSVCVLSAAGGTGAVDNAVPPSLTSIHAADYRVHDSGRSRPAALRFCDSRAPPAH